MKILGALVAFVVLGVSSACELLLPDVKCTTELVPGIVVEVVDNVTGEFVAADEIVVIATDGAYADTTRLPRNQSRSGITVVDDRQGLYNVTVHADGYFAWAVDNVRVTGDDCHVRTVQLTARLHRL